MALCHFLVTDIIVNVVVFKCIECTILVGIIRLASLHKTKYVGTTQHLYNFCVYLPLNGIKKDESAPYFFEEFIHQNKIEKLPF